MMRVRSIGFIVAGVLACASISNLSLHAQSKSIENHKTWTETDRTGEFAHYLELFPLLNNLDSNFRPINVFPMVGEGRGVLNDTNCEFIHFVPFFKTYPIYRVHYNWGILVCVHRSYSNEVTNLDYLEIISYNIKGYQLAQTTIPFFFLESSPCQSESTAFCILSGELSMSDSLLSVNYVMIDNSGQHPYPQARFLVSEGEICRVRSDNESKVNASVPAE